MSSYYLERCKWDDLKNHTLYLPKISLFLYQYAQKMPRTGGRFCAAFLAAFGFNGRLFTGSFDQRAQLGFAQYVAWWISHQGGDESLEWLGFKKGGRLNMNPSTWSRVILFRPFWNKHQYVMLNPWPKIQVDPKTVTIRPFVERFQPP